MGMFDSVYACCPRCNESIEFQSKAGDCRLAGYSPSAVPMAIALDLDNSSEVCPKCNRTVTLHMPMRVDKVYMVVA